MAKGTLTVRVIGDAKPFEKTMGSLGGTAAKAGTAIVGGVAIGGAALVALGDQVLTLGGQLTSWRQKTSTVFEGSAGDIRQWADENNEVFGLTDDQLAGLAASFGDLLKPMGFTADQAADMAKDVVGLSGALSEWSGGQRSAEEVAQILSKAMLGERDSLKELGISITEADVQARLAAKGQNDLTGAALEQAKAIATQELIFEKSTDAQKAFAEGGNEALRAQNELKAGLAELREQIADRLLPIVTEVAKWLAENLPPALQKAGDVAAELKARWDSVFPAIEAVFTAFGDTVSRVIDFVRSIFKQSESDVGGSSSRLGEIIGALGELFSSVFSAIQVVVETAIKVILNLWDRFGSDLITFARETFDNVLQLIDGVLKAVVGIFNLFVAVFSGDWQGAWDAIKEILAGVWDSIRAIVEEALNLIDSAIQVALGSISAVWSLAWNGIKTLASDVIDGIVGFVAGLPARITTAAAGAFDGIVTAFKGAINAVISIWNNLRFPEATFNIPKVHVPGTNIDLGGGTFRVGGWDLPNIPPLAEGGIVRRPTLALIGEAGPEAVVPLNRAGAGVGGSMNVTINMPPGSDGDDVVRALRQWQRRNGPVPISVA